MGLSIPILFALCAISLIAQSVLVVLHPQAMVAFNALIALEFLLAAAGCLRYASRQNAETRALWILVATGFLLSIGGQIQDTYDVLRNIQPTTTATMADFFFLVYGIPVLLAISFTNEESNLRVLFLLDGAQAIVAAVLIYFQIYSILPGDWVTRSPSRRRR